MKTKESLWEKIERIPYFIFDFDGTLYPRILLVDLALDFLDSDPFRSRHETLVELIKTSDSQDFIDLSKRFAHILRGISSREFGKKIPPFLNACYPAASEFIRMLKKMDKTCFLVSLTSEAAAKAITRHFRFDGYWCRKLEKTIDGRFTGSYPQVIKDLAEFKYQSLHYFGINTGFAMAGNSKDDAMLLDNAELRIAVNPKKELQASMEFDYILSGKKDPWTDLIL